MKSQHSNFHVGPSDEDEDGDEDEDEEFDNLDLEFGCKPEEVMVSAVELLDDEDREDVRRLDFGAFLERRTGMISQRQATGSFVRKVVLEEERIAIHVRKDAILYITTEIIF